MASFIRTRSKRITYPLDDRVKARLVGGYSFGLSDVRSGSEHSGDYNSPCLFELVHRFLQNDESSAASFPDESDSASDVDAIDSILRSVIVFGNTDSYMKLLCRHVSQAVCRSSQARLKMLRGSAQLLGLLVWRVQKEGKSVQDSALLHKRKDAEKKIRELKRLRHKDAKSNEKVVSIFAAKEQSWLNE